MTFLAMVLVGLGSYAFRALPLLVLPHLTLSPRAERSLRHASTAAISALTVGALVHPRSSSELGASAIAVVVALALAMRGSSLLRVVTISLSTYAVATVLALA
jgi:branched-subunit amino acid transport protein